MRDSYEFEYKFMDMQFPDLADLDRPRSPEQWEAALKKVRSLYKLIAGLGSEGGAAGSKSTPGAGPDDPASKSPDLNAARKYLIEHRKMTANQAESAPPAQAVLLFLVATYNEFRDDAFKATYLPYPEFKRVFAAMELRREAAPDTEGKRFADALLPALAKVEWRKPNWGGISPPSA